MTEIKLIDLIQKLLPEIDLKYPADINLEKIKEFEQWQINQMLTEVDFIGHANKHLVNPLNRSKESNGFKEREFPLTGEEVVRGDYLLYDLVGHHGVALILQFDSLKELIRFVLNGGGYTNPFTTYQIPIINGQIRRFRIFYTSNGKEHEFNKSNPPPFDTEMTDIRLEWLN